MAGSEPRLHSLFIFRMTGSGLLFQGICLPVTIIIRKPNKYVNPRKKLECVQTDNGTEFTNRFTSNRDRPTLFEQLLKQRGIVHKLIRPYTPRHNGKVERSHRKDNEYFYATHRFYSLNDFKKQLKVHNH